MEHDARDPPDRRELRDRRRQIERAAAGDREALELLLRRCDARVLHLCQRLLCDAEDARDARQWVLIKVARALPRFQGEAAFETWLHRVVVNVCRDRLRERAAQRRLIDRVCLTKRETFESEPETESGMERFEVGGAVAAAVAALPADEREVLVLRHYEGLSFPRIAEILEAAETTLKSRFQRALSRLAIRLKPPFRSGGESGGENRPESWLQSPRESEGVRIHVRQHPDDLR